MCKAYYSAIHLGAYNGHSDVVRLLASHGAELNAANKVLSTIIEIGLTLFLVSMSFYFCVFSCVVSVIAVVFACRYKGIDCVKAAEDRCQPENNGQSLKYPNSTTK